MLFNSFEFILIYLPIVVVAFFWIARSSHRLAALWLGAASLFFYGWWNLQFVSLLLASVGFNYAMGYVIGHARAAGERSKQSSILIAAITSNLLLLGYFKYANFFIATANHIGGSQWGLLDIILPLGISFFTFTQIAFLVDVHRGLAREYSFVHYLLFVTYFPHLIAGPVLHHKQMMPQFAQAATYKFNVDNVNIGMTVFTIGLLKKVILADQFALYANPVFDAVAAGGKPKLIEAWVGSIAYTLQLYFDFSGYSDMAIGVSWIFNVKLPLNFNSPYKAGNIIEFWRRWHMTLSAFLKDYLYLPLGGNRKGRIRRYINLMTTMLLGGLWHGAGWNFVLWGGLHGTYLVINHAWRSLFKCSEKSHGRVYKLLSICFTFSVVVIAWIPFRASDLECTMRMLSGIVGVNGISLASTLEPRLASLAGSKAIVFSGFTPLTGLPTLELAACMATGLLIVFFLPNTQQWVASIAPASPDVVRISRVAWRPAKAIAILVGATLAMSMLGMTRTSQFLYFQF